jgi:hypothetical protein
MRTTSHTTAKAVAPPVPVGSGSRSGRETGQGPFEFEIRVRLTPTQAGLLRCLPIVGNCVRHWRVPVSASDWRPHPTVPGVDIQLGAV